VARRVGLVQGRYRVTWLVQGNLPACDGEMGRLGVCRRSRGAWGGCGWVWVVLGPIFTKSQKNVQNSDWFVWP
jgi:hypothetical protein